MRFSTDYRSPIRSRVSHFPECVLRSRSKKDHKGIVALADFLRKLLRLRRLGEHNIQIQVPSRKLNKAPGRTGNCRHAKAGPFRFFELPSVEVI